MKLSKKLLSLLLCAIMVLGSVAVGGEGLAEVLDVFSFEASAAPKYSVGDIIEYGSYPQSQVTDSSLVSKLNSISGSWKSYGYYSGTGGYHDGQMTASDYMRYKDVSYNGNKYRAVTFDTYRPYATGYKSTTFTSYTHQSDNGYTYGNVYWFKYEPITWRILDPSTGFVMCEKIIDCQAYNNYEYHKEIGLFPTYGNPETTYYSNDYYYSSIRQWLNNEFLSWSFTDEESKNIKTTKCEINQIKSYEYYKDFDYKSTDDQVFLMSNDELKCSKYGFDTGGYSSDTRIAYCTDYSKCQGVYYIKTSDFDEYFDGYEYLNCGSYITRSPCNTGCGFISFDGKEGFQSLFVDSSDIDGIRPAICLKELKSECPKYYFTFADTDFSRDFVYYNVEKYIREKSSTEYDPRMAAFSATLANGASSLSNLEKTLKSLGITNYKAYYDGGFFDPTTTAFSIAEQTTDEGKRIVYVTFRGTRDPSQGVNEWIDNFFCVNIAGGVGPHPGFQRCADVALERLIEFEGGSLDKNNTTYVLTGHSRGAAAAGLLTVKMMDEKRISKNKLYCYTIACPDNASLYVSDWNSIVKTNKYNNIFNINNVKDPVSYVPGILGDLANNAVNTFRKIFTGENDLTVWDKYGTSYWYSWDWNDVEQTSLDLRIADGNSHVHNQLHYWEYLETLGTDFRDRNSAQAIANAITEFATSLIFSCPVDVVIEDANGNKLASVIDGKTNYYSSNIGDILIFVFGDKKLFYIKDGIDYKVNLLGTDNGTMSIEVLRVKISGEIDDSNYISYENIQLNDGKTMTASVSKEQMPQDILFFVTNEENEKIKIIDTDGSETPVSSVTITNFKNITVDYKSSVTLHATANVPGTNIAWFNADNSQKIKDGNEYKESSATSTFKVYAAAVDESGKEIEGTKSETETVTVKTGLWQSILAFFRNLFGKLPIWVDNSKK